MRTDDATQLQILTQIVKKLLSTAQIDSEQFLKNEFKEALTAKYNAFKYPSMQITIKHQ